MVETLREWERSLDARVQGLGARVGADGDALRALEEADPTEAARFGLRLMLVEEMRTLGSSDFALGDRKRAAHGTILRGLRGLSLGELTDALVSGALWVSWTVAWEHHRFAFLSEHPALATPESRLQVVRAVVAASGWTSPIVPWFVHRLIEDPVPDAGDELFAAWQAHRSDARIEYLLAEAVIASGHREGIATIAATLETMTPSHDAVSAVIALDPSTATERLGRLLDPGRFAPGLMRGASMRVLEALSANGLRAGEISGFPSRRPRGWVRADPRWVPLLMALRGHPDPNVARPARSALAHADPAVVAAAKPKPSKKRAGAALTLHLIGSAPFVSGAYWGDPVFVTGDRVALFSAAGRIQIRRLADGLPIEAAFELPAGLDLPAERREPNDDGWDREGIHGVALHPTRDVVALSSFSTDPALGGVLLVDSKGAIVARAPAEDLLPHRLHWGADGTTLWVMAQGDTSVVLALDPETLEERGRCAIGDFPAPAFPASHRHPTEDAACFQVLCGQDGFWVKCVEPTKKGCRVRGQALSTVHHDVVLYGFAEAGATVVTLLDAKLVLRDWPKLTVRKTKTLGGTAHGAAGARSSVVVPIATVGNAADGFEVFRVPDGEKLGTGTWPEGHVLMEMHEDLVITTRGPEVYVWKMSP